MTGFAQTMETVIVTLVCVPPVTMAFTMERRKLVNSSTVHLRRMGQWMRSAVGMGAVTPFEGSAPVKRASLDQDVRTNLVPIVMVCSMHTPQATHATGVGLVMWTVANVHAPSPIMAIRVKSQSALMTAWGLVAAMLRQESVLAQKVGTVPLASSTHVQRIVTARLLAAVTVLLVNVCVKWDTLGILVRYPHGAASHRTQSKSRTGTQCGISQAGSHVLKASFYQAFEDLCVSPSLVSRQEGVLHHVKGLVRMRSRLKSGIATIHLTGMARLTRKGGPSAIPITMFQDYTDHATHCTVCKWPNAAHTRNLGGQSAKRSTGLHHSMGLDGSKFLITSSSPDSTVVMATRSRILTRLGHAVLSKVIDG